MCCTRSKGLLNKSQANFIFFFMSGYNKTVCILHDIWIWPQHLNKIKKKKIFLPSHLSGVKACMLFGSRFNHKVLL